MYKRITLLIAMIILAVWFLTVSYWCIFMHDIITENRWAWWAANSVVICAFIALIFDLLYVRKG